MGKNEKTLSWDAFKALGNPDNAPEMPEEDIEEVDLAIPVRVHLEKKHRGGKTVSIIRGLEELDDNTLQDYCKALKKQCGVGGNMKNGEILIQGNNRDKIKDFLLKQGYKDVKLAGG